MKIALIGYGKMGKEIEAIAIQRGHEVVVKVNRDVAATLTDNELLEADVAIEFSTPNVVVDNIKRCFNIGLPIVVGTTGWYEQFDNIKQTCVEKNATLFHATNFSLGVNLFFKLNTYLAELMNKYTEYDVSMEEIHHIHKLDKPSGTAITLANQILQNIERKKNWSIDSKEKETLFIQDVREGEVPGTHVIKYHSAIDDIEIMHKAHSRKGFALGAVIASEFLKDKKGMYTMRDII
jgi:4-hydroxy-tetrahydrodipicolinate reductase